ncbi:MAG: amidohydrolase family protein [Armatimonadetes bacterium]|nr:amidohydrolase family protein [Armatimonadota bacterium]
MLIDFHTHICRVPSPMKKNGRGPFSQAHDLLLMMDNFGVEKAVLLPVVSPERMTQYITSEDMLEVAALHPTRLIPFCNVDPRMVGNSPTADFRPILRAYKEAGCKGVGEYTANLPFDDPLQMNVFRQVEEVGLPLLFHIGPTLGGCYGAYDELGLPRLEKVMKACPALILLGHSQPFWSEISADVTKETRGGYPKGKVTPGRLVQLMRDYPTLWGDLSANSGFNAITRDPEFGYAFLEEFQDRLLFGTDSVQPNKELPIIAYFRKLKAEKLIAPEAYEKIAWKNASRLLGPGPEGAA